MKVCCNIRIGYKTREDEEERDSNRAGAEMMSNRGFPSDYIKQ